MAGYAVRVAVSELGNERISRSGRDEQCGWLPDLQGKDRLRNGAGRDRRSGSIAGKAAREAASERGRRASFNVAGAGLQLPHEAIKQLNAIAAKTSDRLSLLEIVCEIEKLRFPRPGKADRRIHSFPRRFCQLAVMLQTVCIA